MLYEVHGAGDLVVVFGPRIDPATLGGAGRAGRGQGGPEVRGFLPDLYKHLAVPVRAAAAAFRAESARPAPAGAVPGGRCLDWDQTGPDELAGAIATGIGREVSSRPVETDGAARAAASLTELL